MLYANNIEGVRISPQKDITAFCPGCKSPVIAKMGTIMIHHWSHIQNSECDKWSEGEGDWHLGLKKDIHKFDEENITIEKFMKDEYEWHFADLFLENKKIVIELQHSSISEIEIMNRELFYKDMIWIFDCREAYNESRLKIFNKTSYHTFVWKHCRKSIRECEKPVFLHLGGDMYLEIRKKTVETRMFGWGKIVSLQGILANL